MAVHFRFRTLIRTAPQQGCPNLKDALADLSADLAKHDREAVAEELVLVDKMELLLQ
jgi:hypothetical protein